MPEIKNTFTQGKMNKDLDERLVPSGQYRDAMNIEVSTSDEAGVGTVQNLRGNEKVEAYIYTDPLSGIVENVSSYHPSGLAVVNDQLFPELGICVGSVKDDKTDSLYWYIHNPWVNFKYEDGNLITPLIGKPYKDMILQYKQDIITPVFVDIWGIVHEPDLFSGPSNTVSLTSVDYVEEGMKASGITVDATNQEIVNSYTNLTVEAVTGNSVVFDQVVDVAGTFVTYFVFTKPKVLNFKKKIITGLSIIDDMLFWTDNSSEPKKINIPRSIEGTDPIGNIHTNLINKSQGIDNDNNITPISEEHITVIRKAPKYPPVLEMSDGRRPGVISGTTDTDFSNLAPFAPNNFVTLNIYQLVGATPNIPPFDLEVGDQLVLKHFDGTQPLVPLNNYDIRVVIETVIQNNGGNNTFSEFECKIIDLDPSTPTTPTTFMVDLFDNAAENADRLFEFKFPRFAYRYKYEDGEYSTISPYSEIGFLPGNFDYHPRKGFNIGMKNNLSNISIKEFITPDIPKDVVEIEILYKESVSPNIYIVDTIKPQDTPYLVDDLGNTTNEWNYINTDEDGIDVKRGGKYKIESETIYATLPSNQSLRLWDNVPRVALAQEVSANRLIYANYLQSFDLKTYNDELYKPNFVARLSSFSDLPAIPKSPRKSLKSIREYQLGVVYSDEYGRETPVLTNNTASLKLNKEHGSLSNQISVRLKGQPPKFADSFKFYIKETSNEYYNMAMDRWYDAEDGNIWLSFPSSDRNKVDIDTFLILKKGVESSELVKDKARYKILAIENQAPEFIKLKEVPLGTERHSNTSTSDDIFTQTDGNFPLEGRSSFKVNYLPFNDSSLDNIHELLNIESFLFVRFTLTGTEQSSKDYRITNISAHPATSPTYVTFTIEDRFESDVNFIYDSANTQIRNSVNIEFYRKKPENSPRFDGRFFVKILNDDIVKVALSQSVDEETEYRVVNSRKIHWMSPDFEDKHDFAALQGTTNASAIGPAATGSSYANTLNSAGHNWGKYMAYFRQNWLDPRVGYGYSNTLENRQDDRAVGKYQDVWFIDGMTRAGTIFNPDYFNPNEPTQLSTNSSNATGPLLSQSFAMGGDGIQNYSSSSIMDLSFGAVNQHEDADNAGDKQWGVVQTPGGYINPYYEDQNQFAKKLEPGTMIRWKEDPNGTIYTIQNVVTQHNLRYCSGHDSENALGINNAVNTSADHDDQIEYTWNKSMLFRMTLNKRMSWNPITGEGLDTGQAVMNGYSPNTDVYASNSAVYSGIDWGVQEAIGYTLEIVEPIYEDQVLPEDPAIWETEPKEDIGLDIYHEASGKYPILLDEQTMYNVIRIGSVVNIQGNQAATNAMLDTQGSCSVEFIGGTTTPITTQQQCINNNGIWTASTEAKVEDVKSLSGNLFEITLSGVNVNNDLSITSGKILIFSKDDTRIGFRVLNTISANNIVTISGSVHNNPISLDWHNCYSFANGVESNRIKDDFNDPIIDKGPKVSTTIAEPYKEERRKYGLIYSGIYNSISGVNNLNQFIQAEKITKEINPIYGSIQKLHSKSTADGDLVTLCEDRILKVLANKDALFNADGSLQLTATENVLGQAIPYGGEYGISKNPESFAAESYRAYFTDKSRGAVMRLSRDGLTPISDAGMTDWFRDNLVLYNQFMGSYDERKGDYNLTMSSVDLVDEADPHPDVAINTTEWDPSTTPPATTPTGNAGGFGNPPGGPATGPSAPGGGTYGA